MDGHIKAWRTGAIALAASLLLTWGSGAWADPPTRTVRLGYTTGEVSFLAGGANDWVQASPNRPLWMGDRVWTAAGARAELKTGNAALRLAPETSLSIVAFDDQAAQYEVNQGTVRLRVRSLDRDEAIEIDTPNLAFSIRSAGDYRIDVDSDTTTVAVYRGDGEALGMRNAYAIGAGTRVRFGGTDLGDYQPVPLARADAFDSWVVERTRFEERSTSVRYVAPEVIGYEDLDAYGTWRAVPDYGNVWIPTRVVGDWAPYRYGRWAWVDPWGWTWIDDAPWGFAPFHYGRWAFVESRWCWVPGPRTVRPVYAPALVAFVGGADLGVSFAAGGGGGVAWFPLAPGEVYRPAYTASRDYFTRVNVTNTTINVTQVTNVYNNPRTEIRHVNVERPNAVTAVPTQAFVEARPVQRAVVRVDPQVVQRASVVAAPTQAVPQRASFLGTTATARARPAPTVTERPVIAKRPPPPAPAPIEQREQLVKREGKPLDQAELQKLAPPGNAARANVRVAQPNAPPKPLPATAPEATDKERAPQNVRVQETPDKDRAPQNAQGRTNGHPGQEAVARAASPASSAPPVAADTSKGPRGEERANGATRPEVESKASEPPQRAAAPRAPVERATPPPNQRAPEPASRSEVANAPPRAPSARATQPESAKAPPAPPPEVAKAPQQEPARGPSARPRPPVSTGAPPAAPPESAPRQAMTPSPQARQQPNAVRRPEPPEPPPAPAARQAPPRPEATSRAAPPEPPRQQAAMQPPRPSETRPQPSAPPRAAEAPPQRSAQGKAKGNEKDKDKEDK